MKIRPIAWIVAPDGEPIYSEKAIKISVDDEGGGEFIAIAQGDGEIRIDLEEWPSIEVAIKMAISQVTVHRKDEIVSEPQEPPKNRLETPVKIALSPSDFGPYFSSYG